MTESANGMFDSLMPLGGFCTLFNLFVQVIWGSEGTGTATLFIYLFLAVFLTGLMVGRTPEFLGRKIEQRKDYSSQRDSTYPSEHNLKSKALGQGLLQD